MLGRVHRHEVAGGTEGSIDKSIIRVPSLTNIEMENLIWMQVVFMSGSYH